LKLIWAAAHWRTLGALKLKLPKFKYHPDPIKSGSIVPSENECECCGEKRGYIYKGSPYAEEELVDCICPWCIADGSVHDKFDAEFTDYAGIGDYGSWDEVPDSVKEEVAFRTPGFVGWQQERWWTHCSDAAEFIEIGGKSEVAKYDQSLIGSLKNDCGLEGSDLNNYINALDKENGPTAYIFRCLHCGNYGGYSDIH